MCKTLTYHSAASNCEENRVYACYGLSGLFFMMCYLNTYGEEALPRSNTVITSTTNHPNPPVPIWRQSRNTSECTTLHHLPKLSCYLHQSHATRSTTDRKHDWTWVEQPTYMYLGGKPGLSAASHVRVHLLEKGKFQCEYPSIPYACMTRAALAA